MPVGRWHEPQARTCVSLLPYCTILGIAGYHLRIPVRNVVEVVGLGARDRQRAAGRRGPQHCAIEARRRLISFSVVGKAQSGFSAAAVKCGRKQNSDDDGDASSSARSPSNHCFICRQAYTTGRPGQPPKQRRTITTLDESPTEARPC